MSTNIQTIIEISESEWKILQAQKNADRIVLKRHEVIKTSGRSGPDIEAGLKRFFAPLGARRSDVTVIFPRKKTIFKHMRLPSSDKREIGQMVGLQLINQVPYVLDEIVFSHALLRSDEDGHTHVLAIVVPLAVMDEWLKPLKAAALNVSRITVSSFATSAWFQMLLRRRNFSSDKVFMVVNLDDDHAEACFCQGNTLLFSRHIPLGRTDLHQDGSVGFLEQLQWSMDLYRKEHVHSAFEHVIFISRNADLEDLRKTAEEKWKVSADNVSPFDVLNEKDGTFVAALSPVSSWTNILGLLLNQQSSCPDISPQSFSADYAGRRSLRQRAIALILLVVLLVCAGIWFVIETSVRGTYLERINRDIEAIAPEAERMKSVMEHTRALDEYFSSRVMIADVMEEIYKRTPEDVVYQAIYGSNSGEWIFQGYAQTRSGVNTLQSGLIDSALFDGVQLDYATKRRMGNMDVTDFKIRCQLSVKRGKL